MISYELLSKFMKRSIQWMISVLMKLVAYYLFIGDAFKQVFDISEFFEQDNNEENKGHSEEKDEYIKYIFELKKKFSYWLDNISLNQNKKGESSLIPEAILSRNDVLHQLSQLIQTNEKLFEELKQDEKGPNNYYVTESEEIMLRANFNLILQKKKTNVSKDPIKRIKNNALKDKELKKYIEDELNILSKKLVASIEKVASTVSVTESGELKEKEDCKQYIEKLIEYIGRCGKGSAKKRTIEYLLLTFIRVLSTAGKDQITPKGKRKAKKRIIVI